MKQMLKKIVLNNPQIKIISVILGYFFWYVISQSHIADITISAPVCFYKKPKNLQIEAPEKIKIQLSGKRADLYTIDMNTIAFHIDMQNATVGKKLVPLTKKQLLLPESIRLVRCQPAIITISTTEKTS